MAHEPVILNNQQPWTDPWVHPEYFSTITIRRMVAYVIDIIVIGFLASMIWMFFLTLGFLTLGLAWVFLWIPAFFLPLAYHILFISGPRSATPGMRVVGIRVMSMSPTIQGMDRPTLPQAIIQIVVFYGSVAATGSLILFIALFNARRRTLHDWLAGTVVVNAFPPPPSSVS